MGYGELNAPSKFTKQYNFTRFTSNHESTHWQMNKFILFAACMKARRKATTMPNLMQWCRFVFVTKWFRHAKHVLLFKLMFLTTQTKQWYTNQYYENCEIQVFLMQDKHHQNNSVLESYRTTLTGIFSYKKLAHLIHVSSSRVCIQKLMLTSTEQHHNSSI